LQLTADPATRRPAIRSLADYDHPDTATALLAAYPTFDDAARQDAIQTLASRPAWAGRLLDAVAGGAVPRAHVTAYSARQIAQLGDPALGARLSSTWGELRATGDDKTAEIARWRKALTPGVLARANLPAGRQLFQRLCASCHRLFNEGGALGPDLTGSQRANPDYLLENILDPGAGVSRDFQLHLIRTRGGRVVSGFVVAENDRTLTLASLNEQVTLPVTEIETRERLPQSMMPEGLLQGLTVTEVRDLFGYLARP
jgi:putative heme-binding domain-containing protein